MGVAVTKGLHASPANPFVRPPTYTDARDVYTKLADWSDDADMWSNAPVDARVALIECWLAARPGELVGAFQALWDFAARITYKLGGHPLPVARFVSVLRWMLLQGPGVLWVSATESADAYKKAMGWGSEPSDSQPEPAARPWREYAQDLMTTLGLRRTL